MRKISNILITENNSEKLKEINVSVSNIFNYIIENLTNEDQLQIQRRFHNDETKNDSGTKQTRSKK